MQLPRARAELVGVVRHRLARLRHDALVQALASARTCASCSRTTLSICSDGLPVFIPPASESRTSSSTPGLNALRIFGRLDVTTVPRPELLTQLLSAPPLSAAALRLSRIAMPALSQRTRPLTLPLALWLTSLLSPACVNSDADEHGLGSAVVHSEASEVANAGDPNARLAGGLLDDLPLEDS